MNLDEKLICLRKRQKLSQAEAAERLNVSRQAISRWETGIAEPSADNLRCLSKLYRVPVDHLLHDDMDLPGDEVHTAQASAVPLKPRGMTMIKVSALISLLLLAAVLALGILHIREMRDEEITPIGDMKSERQDDPPAGTFSLGW